MDFFIYLFIFADRLLIKMNNFHTNVVKEAHFPLGPFAPRDGTMDGTILI